MNKEEQETFEYYKNRAERLQDENGKLGNDLNRLVLKVVDAIDLLDEYAKTASETDKKGMETISKYLTTALKQSNVKIEEKQVSTTKTMREIKRNNRTLDVR